MSICHPQHFPGDHEPPHSTAAKKRSRWRGHDSCLLIQQDFLMCTGVTQDFPLKQPGQGQLLMCQLHVSKADWDLTGTLVSWPRLIQSVLCTVLHAIPLRSKSLLHWSGTVRTWTQLPRLLPQHTFPGYVALQETTEHCDSWQVKAEIFCPH